MPTILHESVNLKQYKAYMHSIEFFSNVLTKIEKTANFKCVKNGSINSKILKFCAQSTILQKLAIFEFISIFCKQRIHYCFKILDSSRQPQAAKLIENL